MSLILAIRFPSFNKAKKYAKKAKADGHMCVTYQSEPFVAIELDVDDLVEDSDRTGNPIGCTYFEEPKLRVKVKPK